MNLIIIAGLPATGKTTLANRIAEKLHLPVLEKDEIKEEMFDTVGYADLPEKRRLDVAANAVLLRCSEKILQSGQSLIVVNNFDSDMAPRVQEMIDRCGCKCITVFLNGDPEVLYRRYVERDRRRARHPGHTTLKRYPPQPGDAPAGDMTREYFADRFEGHGMAEFRLNGPRIDLDATNPETIDPAWVTEEILEALK